jgi:broad specificity phosphatase PhoE
MGRLILVRHGQASFGAADYDQLSPLGEEQSRALGAWWEARGILPDAVYSGPRRRHLQSDAAARERFTALPEVGEAPGLDEYPAFDLLAKAGPLLADDPEIAALLNALKSGGGPATQKLVQAVTSRWVRGELDVPGVITWIEFRARVEEQLHALLTAHLGRSQTIVAFTSAGPVSAVVGYALGLDHERTIELSWNLYNASTTTFLFTRGRFNLSEFNVTSHLDATGTTYR